MFTQRISMDCTQQQYEKYLKAELEKMGYDRADDFYSAPFSGILTGWNSDYIIQSYNKGGRENDSRTYLGKFNAPLFLALAAITDNQDGINEEYFTDGGAIIMRKSDLINNTRFVGLFRKATVSEIMAKFGEQPQRGAIEFKITLDAKDLSEQIEKLAMGIQMTEQLIKLEGELRKAFDTKEEPKHKEPIIGEMAIFWDNDKKYATCSIYVGGKENGCETSRGSVYMYAILFESIEQYKKFINE